MITSPFHLHSRSSNQFHFTFWLQLRRSYRDFGSQADPNENRRFMSVENAITQSLSILTRFDFLFLENAWEFNRGFTERNELNNNYSMSLRWIWSDKITNERVARVGYNHVISNKGEWNNCFSKFSNRVLPPIFISTILQSVRKEHTTSGHPRLDSRHHLSIT